MISSLDTTRAGLRLWMLRDVVKRRTCVLTNSLAHQPSKQNKGYIVVAVLIATSSLLLFVVWQFSKRLLIRLLGDFLCT